MNTLYFGFQKKTFLVFIYLRGTPTFPCAPLEAVTRSRCTGVTAPELPHHLEKKYSTK